MEQLEEKLNKIWNKIDDAMWELSEAKEEIEQIQYENRKNTKSIKDIDSLKRELKRDGLYSDKLEEFLENYMKYYNN